MKRKVLAALLCGVLLGAAPVYAAENQSGETVSVSEDVSSDVSPEKGSENETPVVALTSGFQWITGSDGQAKLYYVTAGGSISRGNHTAYTRAEDTVSWLVVDGRWYLVDVSDGHLLSGWQTVDRNLYYFNPDTYAMETGNQTRGGWAMIDGQWYSFRNWGGARKGWYFYDNCWYYLYADGHMENTSATVNGKTYFFRSWGGMYANAVVSSGDARYYVQADGSVCTKTGWIKDKNKWYWIKDGSGRLAQNEWITYDNNRYYLKADGTMASSEWIDDTWYFKSWGGMYKGGWLKVDGVWYYLNEDGTKHADGWLYYLNNWYYLKDGGRMAANEWIKHDNNWYYFKSWGGMYHDEWLVKGGSSYYFRSWGGMYSSTTVTIGGRQYTFDESGHKVSVQSEWTKLASGLNAAKTHNQLIFVSADGTSATVAMVTKDADGTWNEDLCTSSYVGYGGVGETTEWNRKTPRGQFSFTYAFGILPNPGTELSYTQVDDTYYWVDDVNSRYYNQFVTTKTTPKAWNFPADAFLFRKTR